MRKHILRAKTASGSDKVEVTTMGEHNHEVEVRLKDCEGDQSGDEGDDSAPPQGQKGRPVCEGEGGSDGGSDSGPSTTRGEGEPSLVARVSDSELSPNESEDNAIVANVPTSRKETGLEGLALAALAGLCGPRAPTAPAVKQTHVNNLAGTPSGQPTPGDAKPKSGISGDVAWPKQDNFAAMKMWKKYGQKLVKKRKRVHPCEPIDTANAEADGETSKFRCYYRCNFPGCQAKQQVEKIYSADGVLSETRSMVSGVHCHPESIFDVKVCYDAQ